MALSAEEKLRLLLQGSAPATSAAVVSTSGLPGSTGVSSSMGVPESSSLPILALATMANGPASLKVRVKKRYLPVFAPKMEKSVGKSKRKIYNFTVL